MKKKIILITMLLLMILSIIKSIYIFNFKFKAEKNYTKKECMIIRKEKQDENKSVFLVKYMSCNFLLNIYNNTNENVSYNFSYGDIIKINGKIIFSEKLNNPYEFDYKLYLNSNNIVATINTNKVEKIGHKKGNLILNLGYTLKENLDEKITNLLPTKSSNLFMSMLYGNDILLEENIKNNFNESGMSHVLAVSGMHISYILIVLKYIFKNSNKNISILITIFSLIIFCVISFLSLSVIRASIMGSLSFIATKNNINISSYKKLLISLYIIMLFNPYSIFNASCILSYLATLGIILFYSLISSYIKVKLNFKKENIFISTFCITLSSQILLIPMQIYYFGYVNLFSLFTNVILSPLISIEFLFGFIAFFFSFVPIISNILYNANYIILSVIIYAFEILSKLNYFNIYIPRLTLFEMFMYYFSIFVIITKKFIVLFKVKKYRKYLRYLCSFIIFFTFIIITTMSIYRLYFEEYIYFFNVGQGNMALIRENRKNIIVDIGSTTKNLAFNTINSFLKAKAIYNIDLILITHMHEDHVNGLYNLAQDYNIEYIAYSIPKTNSSEYDKVISCINNYDIKKIELNLFDNLTLGNIDISTLSPPDNYIISSSDILNSNSTIYQILTKKHNILFLGDSTKETEKYLINNINSNLLLNVDILQVGHHGSNTSTSDILLKNINFATAIISSKKSVYGHPSIETLDILKKYNFEVKITEKDGAIKF